MEVAGVVNMGAEGMMIIGSLVGIMASNAFGNVWAGALIAMLAAGAFGALFGFLVIELRINQVVLGVAFNLAGYGLTTTLNRAFSVDGIILKCTYFKDALGFYPPVYIGLGLVALVWIILYKTNFGIQLRSVGENPMVVECMGISVKRLRYTACIIGAMLVGFGGSFLSTGLLSRYAEQMTDGRGYIALAAVTFGKYTPIGTLAGVLIFGAGDTLSLRLQAGGSGFPYQIALMIPYVLTVVALCFFSHNVHDPASLGVPYTKNR